MICLMERGNPRTMSRLNQRLIFNEIMQQGPISRAELAKSLKLSAPSVSANVKALLESKVIVESGIGNMHQVGRRSTLLDINKQHGLILSTQIATNNIRTAVADFVGNILHYESVPYTPEQTILGVVDRVIETSRKVLQALPPTTNELLAAAVGVHGVKSDRKSKNYLHIYRDGTNLQTELHNRFEVPVIVENDVRLAVIGEKWKGLIDDVHDLIYINIEDGIGAGILIADEVLTGSENAAGEIGHLVVDSGATSSTVKDDGPLETLLLTNPAATAILAGKPIDSNDEAAGKMIRTVAYMLTNVSAVLNPSQIVLGGRIGIQLQEYYRDIRTLMERFLPTEPPQLLPAKTGDRSVVYGGIRVALDQTYRALFREQL